MSEPGMNRRDFLRAGLGGSALALAPRFVQTTAPRAVSLVVDPADAVATAAPVTWALGALEQTLSAAGHRVRRVTTIDAVDAGDVCLLASGTRTPVAVEGLARARIIVAAAPESLAICTTRIAGRETVLACGVDARALVYALLEIAERVRAGGWPASLATDPSVVERPANPVRSVMRQFTCEALDKPWFYDRDGWRRYLSMLAGHRFNRIHLAFGLGYDTLQQVADSYLLFLYPFLLPVPGYDVRVSNLPDEERDRNLDTLKFVSDEAVARGLEFQLGVWMHGYQLGEWLARAISGRGPDAGHAPGILPRCAHGRPARTVRRSRRSVFAFTARAESPRAATTSGRRCSTASDAPDERSRSICTPRASIRR